LKEGVTEEQIIYLNFESLKYINLRSSGSLYGYVKENVPEKKKVYLFFDEIQMVEDWESAVNSFLVDFDADIYVTGSNSSLLSSEISTLLTGRYVQIGMQPLVFSEFLLFNEGKAKEENLEELLWRFIRVGGFPSVNSYLYNERDAYTLIGDIYDSIVLRDAVERFGIKNIELMDRILRFVMDNIGNTFSAKKIADYFKSQRRSINQNTVYSYLNALESTFLIRRVNRYDLHGKEILKTQEKFYLADQGILNSINGYSDRNIPGILENIVCNELIFRGYSVYIGKNKDKEVDFLAVKGKRKVYFQVAYRLTDEKVIDREFGALLSIDDHYPKYVLSMEKHFDDNIKGIEHMTILQFLTTDKWRKQ
jgi:hypothetical protein